MYASSVRICTDTCICDSLQGFQHTKNSQTAKLSPRDQQPSELNTGKSPQTACSQKTQQQQQNGGFISKEWWSSIPFVATTPRLEPALLAQHHGLFTGQKCSWGCWLTLSPPSSSPDLQEVVVTHTFPNQVVPHLAPCLLVLPQEDDVGLDLLRHALQRGIGRFHVCLAQTVFSPV